MLPSLSFGDHDHRRYLTAFFVVAYVIKSIGRQHEIAVVVVLGWSMLLCYVFEYVAVSSMAVTYIKQILCMAFSLSVDFDRFVFVSSS